MGTNKQLVQCHTTFIPGNLTELKKTKLQTTICCRVEEVILKSAKYGHTKLDVALNWYIQVLP